MMTTFYMPLQFPGLDIGVTTKVSKAYKFGFCLNLVPFAMAWAFFALKAWHCADSHPVLTNKVSRCCN